MTDVVTLVVALAILVAGTVALSVTSSILLRRQERKNVEFLAKLAEESEARGNAEVAGVLRKMLQEKYGVKNESQKELKP